MQDPLESIQPPAVAEAMAQRRLAKLEALSEFQRNNPEYGRDPRITGYQRYNNPVENFGLLGQLGFTALDTAVPLAQGARGISAFSNPLSLAMMVAGGTLEGALADKGGFKHAYAAHELNSKRNNEWNTEGANTLGGLLWKAYGPPTLKTIARTSTSSAVDKFMADVGDPIRPDESYEDYFVRTGWRPDYNDDIAERVWNLVEGRTIPEEGRQDFLDAIPVDEYGKADTSYLEGRRKMVNEHDRKALEWLNYVQPIPY